MLPTESKRTNAQHGNATAKLDRCSSITIEALSISNQQAQSKLDTIDTLLQKQQTQSNNTEHMLQSIFTMLQNQTTTKSKQKVQTKITPKLNPPSSIEDSKLKRQADTLDDHSSKNSRSSSISTTDAVPMDIGNAEIDHHQPAESPSHNTRNTKVSHYNIAKSVNPYTIANRAPLFVRHSGNFSINPTPSTNRRIRVLRLLPRTHTTTN